MKKVKCECGHLKDEHLKYGSRTLGLESRHRECGLCACRMFRPAADDKPKEQSILDWQKDQEKSLEGTIWPKRDDNEKRKIP